MRNVFPKIFFFALIFLFPLISLAVIQTGAPCDPDIMPPSGSPAGTCPITMDNPFGNEFLHLKWDVQGQFKEPICRVLCRLPTNNGSLPCINFDPNPWEGDSIWSLCHREEGGILSTTSVAAYANCNLKPKDDVYIQNVHEGQYYNVSCIESAKSKTSGSSLKESSLAVTKRVEACELPFGVISNSLDDYQPTTITEENLRSWSTLGFKDLSSRGGSGEEYDIKEKMVYDQCQGISDMNGVVFGQDGGVGNSNQVIETLKEASLQRDAIPLSFLILEKGSSTSTSTDAALGIHVAISLGIVSHSPNYDKFQLKTLDSNVLEGRPSGIGNLSCKAVYGHWIFELTRFGGKDSLSLKESPLYLIKKFYKCSYPLQNDSSLENYIILFKYPYPFFEQMSKQPNQRQNTADYLSDSNNVLAFRNFIDELSPLGTCAGWTKFTLGVAYFGHFVGYDYHPGDGKYVGKDCDANHYPLPPKTTLANSWLASLSQVFINLNTFSFLIKQ